MTDTPETPIDAEKVRGGIESIFAGIMRDRQDNARARLAERMNDPEFVKAAEALAKYDYEAFLYRYVTPFDELTTALVFDKLKDNYPLAFLFRHADFVSKHLTDLFTRFEGYSSCVDKTRTVIRGLARFYHRGEAIRFNYEAEYTYSPRRILKTHDDIVSYYDGLRRLHGGDPDQYFKEYAKIVGMSAIGDAT